MYPNPQAALPLPPRPNIDQYKKQAKELVKTFKGGTLTDSDEFDRFARQKLSERCTLANAQFVIARAYGFASWPKFVRHIESLSQATETARFESAADAIVRGEIEKVRQLLQKNPELVRARSTREHHATLLHYVSANGVEGYRQKSPKNIAEIARMLLDAGAEVDAEADVYESRCTTLGLVATSAPPDGAGVQIPLIQLLLERGARMDRSGSAGRRHSLVFACLANGQPRAARFLADRGAPLDLAAAAGLGRLDVVPALMLGATPQDRAHAFIWACAYGQNGVVTFLLDNGVDIASQDKDGQTGLHWAVIVGRLETVKLLLQRKAPLDVRNVYGGTPLGQAAWSAAHNGDPEVYAPILETLMAAGSKVPERHPPINARIDALLERYGTHSDPTLTWSGERPVSGRRRRGGRARS